MKYKIESIKPEDDYPNWVCLSSIDKKTFYDFIDYLYSLDRDIEVLPYIPGGAPLGIPKPYLDQTYIVRGIASDIKNKRDIDEILSQYFDGRLLDKNKRRCFHHIHFKEDVYEYLLDKGIDKDIIIKNIHIYKDKDVYKIDPSLVELANWIKEGHSVSMSRYVFIYMFRNEFIKYMASIGCEVEVDGGWILNSREREAGIAYRQ